jgi:hypothetical protein
VHDQQRQRFARLVTGRSPDAHFELDLECSARDQDLLRDPTVCGVIEPGRRSVLWPLDYRLVPEWARRPQGIARITHCLDIAGPANELQLVFEPIGVRAGKAEGPRTLFPNERRAVAWPADLLQQIDGSKIASRVGNAKRNGLRVDRRTHAIWDRRTGRESQRRGSQVKNRIARPSPAAPHTATTARSPHSNPAPWTKGL